MLDSLFYTQNLHNIKKSCFVASLQSILLLTAKARSTLGKPPTNNKESSNHDGGERRAACLLAIFLNLAF